MLEIAIRKTNLLYILQDYYKLIQRCQKHYTFLVNGMKLKTSIQPNLGDNFKKNKILDGETVKWLNIF